LINDDQVRSIHGTSYTRLFNADLLTVVREFATDFEAPPEGVDGGTGLCAGNGRPNNYSGTVRIFPRGKSDCPPRNPLAPILEKAACKRNAYLVA